MVTGRVAVEHEALKNSSADFYGYTICLPFIIPKDKIEWLAYSPDFRHVPGGDNGGILALLPQNDEEFLKAFKYLKPKR